MELLERVRTFCQRHNLLTAGPLVVAVSGGPDSLALLHILLALRQELGIAPHVATLDHGLRGEAGAADRRFVEQIAAQWGIPCTSRLIPVLAESNKQSGIEAVARRVRYGFLRQVAQEIGAAQIATGHTRDDQAETVLLHVLRGSGLRGLRGMLPKTQIEGGLTLIRPLLEISRAEIETYLAAQGLTAQHDATNDDPTFTRNRLRHQVLPLLHTINPAVSEALARTAEIARDDYEALHAGLPPIIREGDKVSVDRAVLLKLPVSQRRLLLREMIGILNPEQELTFQFIEKTLAQIRQPGAPSVPIRYIQQGQSKRAGLWLQVKQTSVTAWYEGETGRPFPHESAPALTGTAPIHFVLGGEAVTILINENWLLSCQPVDHLEPVPAEPLCATLNLPLGAAIALRTRRTGDRFQPFGMGGRSQKIQDTLTNLHVPSEWRDVVPLVTVNDTIAWIVAPTEQGLVSRIAEPFAVKPDSADHVWRLRFEHRPHSAILDSM